jgi:hypothetical protein
MNFLVLHVMYTGSVGVLSPVRRNQDQGPTLEHCDDCARLSLSGTLDSES